MESFKPGDKLIRINCSWGNVKPGDTVEVEFVDYGGDLRLVGHEGINFMHSNFMPATLENVELQIKKEIGL